MTLNEYKDYISVFKKELECEKVVDNLCSLPATDLSFMSELKRATTKEILLAIKVMEENGGKNKGRTRACMKELEERRLTKRNKDGEEYVSKKHLSVIHNTFSSKYYLRAILHKLGEYEDAERQGMILQLPCKKVWYICDKGSQFATIMSKDILDLPVYEIKNIDKSGNYWSSKEGAEAQLKELKENKDAPSWKSHIMNRFLKEE